MLPRTKRQREILAYIQNFVVNHGYEPSYQQIANHLGVKSKGGIAKHIESLEKKGLLERHNINGSFHLELTPQRIVSDFVCEIEWIQNPQQTNRAYENEHLYIPKFLLGYLTPSDVRAATVEDNGMIDDHICLDDIALFESKSFARDGEIVAALINEEHFFIRKFYRMGSEVELVPSNDNYETYIQPADRILIIGVFRGILRPLM